VSATDSPDRPPVSTLLDDILAPGRLSVVFQPILDMSDARSRLFALECLIRGPRGTNAERTEVLFDYVRRKQAEYAVDRACVAAALAEAGRLPGEPRLSLNAHAATLDRDPGFLAFLLDRAGEAGIDPRRVVLEIVEATPPRLGGASFRHSLDKLRGAGITIALDDVGLGQSNYKMILDVRPEIYKLDRYLVANAWSDSHRLVILDSIARMVHRLEARAVAEGVESREELVAVQAAGIDLVQGFFLARPLARAELLDAGYLSGPPDPAAT
jgi:EAL domain-containing protein (putative c-di-GMP-specific phosphodiesterase class I)